MLALVESGYTPERSNVVDRVWAVLDAIEREQREASP
jgi:hypothetical protein